MDHYIEIVQANPIGVQITLIVQRQQAHFLFEIAIHPLRQSLHLRMRLSFADDEKIGGGTVQIAQVQLDYPFAFNILQTFNDALPERLSVLYRRQGAVACFQIVLFVYHCVQ